MEEKWILSMGLSGPNIEGIFRYFIDVNFFDNLTLTKLRVDDDTPDISDNWADESLASYQYDIFAEFGDVSFISLNKNILKIVIEDYPIDPRAMLDLLAPIDFELCSFDTIHGEWDDDELGEKYFAPGFADMHWPHGWACAFKGAGHERLVSRRWLDFGPWRVLRGPNDTTLVQFHDLDVDHAVALEQARVGHERMGIRSNGGFLQTGFVYKFDLNGIYFEAENLLKIVVHGREVSQREMLEACAIRHYDALGPEKPVANVAYVFMEESEARAHLHELWLRGLECRAIIDGEEVRLDSDYHPTPQKPQWVLDLEAKD